MSRLSFPRLTLPLVLAIVCFVSSPASAYDPPVLLRKWGTTGTTPGNFQFPAGVAHDASGNIYVADGGNNRIQKFSNNGAFITQWGSYGTGDGQFQNAFMVTVDASGNVYVTDTGCRITKFTGSGTFLAKWGSAGTGNGEFHVPAGIAVDAAGSVYVCDLFNSRVQKFTSTGTYVGQWGSHGTGDGQFSSARDVAISSTGNVYVIDYVEDFAGGRIQEFTSSGAFIRKWGSFGTGDGQFVFPGQIAIDAMDRVYVADILRSDIQVFTSAGVFLGRWGTHGSGGGQFGEPSGLTVDGSGNVFVSDDHLNRIQEFGGSSVHFFPTLDNVDWKSLSGPNGSFVRFDLRWGNTSTQQASQPLTGSLFPQPFGAFLPDFPVPVGSFDVIPVPPSTHFDIFVDVPFDQLPPSAPLVLRGGGPGPGDPCPAAEWIGNVDVVWSEDGEPAQSNWHGGEVLVAPGGGTSYVHIMTGCTPTKDFSWVIAGECPGFSAALMEQDRLTPAPDSLPPGWHGFIAVSAAPGTPVGQQCCFDVFFACDELPTRIEVCANTCSWATADVPHRGPGAGFGILAATPNPTRQSITIRFETPKEGPVHLEIFDAAGRAIRTLVDGTTPAGVHLEHWDGRGARGETLVPGAYFLRLRSAERHDARMIVLAR